MSNSLNAILTFALLFALMLLRVPIGIAMAVCGVVSFGIGAGWGPAINMLAQVPLSVLADYSFSVIPLFILMGAFASRAGMSTDLFRAARAWFGHLPGGLAISTVAACGGFAAINGSAVASTATMTRVALPEMRRAGYPEGFSAGAIAVGSTAGIMIPPSGILVLYGLQTDTDIARLFAAGIVPGILGIIMYAVTVALYVSYRPARFPRHAKAPWGERWAALPSLIPIGLLFGLIMGGMYGGLFTATEAAAFGAVGALVIGVGQRRLSLASIQAALVETLRVSAAVFLIVIGAYVFGYALTITQTTQMLVETISGLPLGPYGILAAILLGYLILGAIMDELAMILLTVPIVFPVITGLGFDPVWFGVIVVMAVTLGLTCPPIGLNVFIVNSLARDIGLVSIYRGAAPFIATDIVRLIILAAFPALSLALPAAMDQSFAQWTEGLKSLFAFIP